ncbi:pyrroline-5-carboxylate reductase [Guyparkeria halophila]|uniref:Pyrroline-5-carboxylate reductase n=1 Tax=Guyparkeria halophila TaxID=47960 RepID=A0A6I6D0C7_9GAMM|nr:pyrroline-5-carboxylate reductase [Guyparkeria halophila]QGT79160.1 pyrroline-5-carboxylate reductase [Guyparkeria halophila]
MNASRIAFIGGGNMAAALIGGMLKDAPADARPSIVVAEPDADRRRGLADQLGVEVTEDNHAAIDGAQLVVLAVKPQVMQAVAEDLAPHLAAGQLVVSIAAGIPVAALARWLNGHAAIVRAMPNTPSMVGCGATGLFAAEAVSREQHSDAESLMRAVGVVQWLDDESQIDEVTALSGSGPAYVFYLMESMQAAAEGMGMAPDVARLLTLETVFGAAKLALAADDSPAELRRRVSSPGGTTERAIAALDEAGVRDAFARAIRASRDRSRELAADVDKRAAD